METSLKGRLLENDKHYQGKPCKYGHSGIRFKTNYTCIECAIVHLHRHRPLKGKVETERQAAVRLKQIRYTSKTPCEFGHTVRFSRNGGCVECAIRKSKEWKKTEAGKEFFKKYSKTYRLKYKNNEKYRFRKVMAQNRRTHKKSHATPSWANQDLIECKYIEAKFMEWFTGEKYHVDHVIPLQGKTVCGLHVETNLQVIPAKENWVKNNKFGE